MDKAVASLAKVGSPLKVALLRQRCKSQIEAGIWIGQEKASMAKKGIGVQASECWMKSLKEFIAARVTLGVNVQTDVVGIDGRAKAVELVNHCVNPTREGIEISIVDEEQCQLFVYVVAMTKLNIALIAVHEVHYAYIVMVHYHALILHHLLLG